MNGDSIARAINACRNQDPEKNDIQTPTAIICALVDEMSQPEILDKIILWSDSDEHGTYQHDSHFITSAVLMVAVADPSKMKEWFTIITKPIRTYQKEFSYHSDYLEGTITGLLHAVTWLNQHDTRNHFKDGRGLIDDNRLNTTRKECASILAKTILALPSTDQMDKACLLAKKFVEGKGPDVKEFVDELSAGLKQRESLIRGSSRQIITNVIYGRLAIVLKTGNPNVIASILELI